MTKLKSAPRRLVLELTNACNLNCIMCGRNAANFAKTFFKLEWLEKFVPIMNQIEEVSMFGWGEPTVHPRFVEILSWLDKYPVQKYFCTNGMKLGTLTDAIFQYKVDIIATTPIYEFCFLRDEFKVNCLTWYALQRTLFWKKSKSFTSRLFQKICCRNPS